jgi:hypothetical protein
MFRLPAPEDFRAAEDGFTRNLPFAKRAVNSGLWAGRLCTADGSFIVRELQ